MGYKKTIHTTSMLRANHDLSVIQIASGKLIFPLPSNRTGPLPSKFHTSSIDRGQKSLYNQTINESQFFGEMTTKSSPKFGFRFLIKR